MEFHRPINLNPSGEDTQMGGNSNQKPQIQLSKCQNIVLPSGENQIHCLIEPISDWMVSWDTLAHYDVGEDSGLEDESTYPSKSDRRTPPLEIENQNLTLANVVVSQGCTHNEGRCWPSQIQIRRPMGDCWIMDPIPGQPEYKMEKVGHKANSNLWICWLPFIPMINIQNQLCYLCSIHEEDVWACRGSCTHVSRHIQVHGGIEHLPDPKDLMMDQEKFYQIQVIFQIVCTVDVFASQFSKKVD